MVCHHKDPFPGWYDVFDALGPGSWHQMHIINQLGFAAYYEVTTNAVEWIQNSISDWESKCRWVQINDCSYFRFLEQQDAAMFKLTFSEYISS